MRKVAQRSLTSEPQVGVRGVVVRQVGVPVVVARLGSLVVRVGRFFSEIGGTRARPRLAVISSVEGASEPRLPRLRFVFCNEIMIKEGNR